jgi:hypothetical protein
MTVATIINRAAYTGNGATTSFSYPYPVQDETDLVVVETVIATGVDTVKTLTTHYTVTIAGGGGSATVDAVTAPANTVTWTIYRDPALTQSTDWVDNDPDSAANKEDAFDKLTMISQRTRELVTRSLRQPEGDAADIGALPAKVTRASKVMTFDADGDPVATAFADVPVFSDLTLVNGDAAKMARVNAAETGMELRTPAQVLTDIDAVAGPASATDSSLARFDGTTGKLLKDGAVIGTDVQAYDAFLQALSLGDGGLSLINGTLTAAVGSSALTIAVKTKAGGDPSASDPVYVSFRNATAATGDYTTIALTAATSFVVSSGSTLGASSATAFKLWVVGFNDGGTFRLGVINCLSGKNIYPLGGWPIASSTAEGGSGGADSAHVFYTGSAVTSKAYTILGYASWETGLTTAGTWDAAPTRLHLFERGDKLPGDIISRVVTDYVAAGTTATTIADDDTIPQITEGAEFITAAITPVSAANFLSIRASLFVSSTGQRASAALFQDATADALSSGQTSDLGTAAALTMRPLVIEHHMLAGTTSSTTLRLRAGPSSTSAGTLTMNGYNSSRVHGGVARSYLRVMEMVT